MSALLSYIEAWVAGDVSGIAACVAPDCEITESYGPVYRGREIVERWARTWFEAGGMVHEWTVTSHLQTPDHEFAEWSFECTWAGRRSRFDGCSVANVNGETIRTLREYQTTAALYDWTGEWR